MGARNEGEKLTAEEAEVLLRYMLESTTPEGGGSGQILEQFNFVDNTQRYVGTHAQIAEDHIDAFLSAAAPLLKASTGGYGLWAPRDYRLNILYNTAFLDAGRGWSLQGGEWLPGGGASLGHSSRLSQRIERKISWLPRIHPFTEIRLELDVKPRMSWRREAVTMRARLNGGEWRTLAPTSIRNRFAAMLPADFEGIFKHGIDFEMENAGRPVSVLRLQLYDQTYAAGVRDVDGKPGAYLDGVRRFNRQLC
jgi:hypothetical protein